MKKLSKKNKIELKNCKTKGKKSLLCNALSSLLSTRTLRFADVWLCLTRSKGSSNMPLQWSSCSLQEQRANNRFMHWPEVYALQAPPAIHCQTPPEPCLSPAEASSIFCSNSDFCIRSACTSSSIECIDSSILCSSLICAYNQNCQTNVKWLTFSKYLWWINKAIKYWDNKRKKFMKKKWE